MLQAELRRVGCYSGQPHGLWTTASRRAMREFIERVNATLPTDKPDGILLALVQTQTGKVCGTSCPPGEGFASTGQCVPVPLLADRGGAKVATMARLQSPATSAWMLAPVAAESGSRG